MVRDRKFLSHWSACSTISPAAVSCHPVLRSPRVPAVGSPFAPWGTPRNLTLWSGSLLRSP
eukprot:9752462-Alexandrium_andersonii.AAC.1